MPPDNAAALRAQTETFLRQAPPVENRDAFSLEGSMQKTLGVYRAVLERRVTGGDSK